MLFFKCCNEYPALLLSLIPNCRAGYNSQFGGFAWVVRNLFFFIITWNRIGGKPLYIYICWFNFDALAQGNAYKPTHKRNRQIIVDPAGIELTTSRLRQLRQLLVVQHVHFTPLKLRKKRNSSDMPEAALDNWQPVGNAQVSISKPVSVNFELSPGAGDIHICWFNFDALAQGNVYKRTKEPINSRGPDGDRTHDLQTETTPPAASCPARTLHDTEVA